jgi:Ribbon-helix-helix protein, copG family
MPRTRKLQPREDRVSFRLAPAEYAALETQAKAAGVNVSAFIRAAFPALLSEAGRMQKGRARRSSDNALPGPACAFKQKPTVSPCKKTVRWSTNLILIF